jgi:hypothetical protein
VDLHYKILTQSEALLNILRTLQTTFELNNLQHLDDSITLC